MSDVAVVRVAPRDVTKTRSVAPALLSFAAVVIFAGAEFEVGPVNLRPFDFFLAGSLLVLLLEASARNTAALHGRIASDTAFLAFIAFAVYVVGYSIWFDYLQSAVKEAVQFTEYILFALVLAHATRDDRRRAAFFRGFSTLLGVGVVLTVLAHVAQGQMVGYKEFDEPKVMFGIWATLMVTSVLASTPRLRTALWMVGIPVMLMLLSGERKGWAAFLGALLFVMLMRKRPRGSGFRRLAFVALLACVSVIAVLAASQAPYVGRQMAAIVDFVGHLTPSGLASYEEALTRSNQTRLFLLYFAWLQFRQHFWLGVGPERFKPILEESGVSEFYVHGAHNEYVRIAVELGVIGLVSYLLVGLCLLWGVSRNAARLRSPDSLRIGALAVYGIVINAFLGGGGVNLFFLALPLGLYLGLRYPTHPRARGFRAPAASGPAADTEPPRVSG